jgi:hypothetical protein
MSIQIRTRRADGHEDEELHAREAEGMAALERNLSTHRSRGHTVTPNGSGTLYTVTDRHGVFVQESEVVRE